MIAKNLSTYQYSKRIAEIIQSADLRFTNCESLFHNGESYPMPRAASVATLWYAEPALVNELHWFGFNMTSLANTHATDFGPQGVLSTLRALDDSGIVCAGAGRDLDEAREAKYLETSNGRVALISACWDSWHSIWERASNGRSGFPPRPGMNLLRVKSHHVIRNERMQGLSDIIREAGLNPPSGHKSSPKNGEIEFLGHSFKSGEKTGTFHTVHPGDRADLTRSVEDARRLADWVLVSFHSHTSSPSGLEYPSDLIRDVARTCIDSGADAFIGHGPHILRGIEIYRKKPIFYSLGNFIAHNNSVKKVTNDQYDFYSLGPGAKPSDFYKAREGVIPPSESPYSEWWYQSVVSVFELDEEGISGMRLFPITLKNEDRLPSETGNPVLADQQTGRKVVDTLTKLSREFGTNIEYSEGCGLLSQ